jgi:predicted O-methyltransferase YrrM
MAVLVGLASGASPAATFPNSHLLEPRASLGAWAPPQQQCMLDELRKAVQEEDWARNYAESVTKIHMQAQWSASPQRCAMLQMMASASKAGRVLEIGSFCGAAALALAEALPAGGEVLALELDEYVVNFAKRFQARSPSGHKVKHMVGPAAASLQELADAAAAGKCKPFDFVVVDADKEFMKQYFDQLWNTPGMLSEDAVVCVDLTPFKGQPPLRYLKYGFPYQYEAESGQKTIDALRASVVASERFAAYEFGQMLVVQEKRGR